MFKIKNKFIIFIVVTIFVLFCVVIFKNYLLKTVDRNSYVVLLSGNAQLNDKLLIKDLKEKLVSGDKVRTIGDDSLAVLEWGDGSITRLGGNTSIMVDDLYVSDDGSQIQVKFKLLAGKTWSNVLSFLGEGSFFKEEFRDSVAAVRGTIFNLDLTNDYLIVQDHKLELTTPSNERIIVDVDKPIDIINFNFIKLEEFINKIKDTEWEKLNLKIDNELLNGLKEQIHSDLDNLIKIKDIDIESVLANEENKNKLYYKILEDYQKINFIKSDDSKLFEKKLEMKEALLLLASEEDKKSLTNSIVYDFKDIVTNKNFENLNRALSILTDNKKYIPEIDFKNFFKNGIIPEDVKNVLKSESEKLRNIFGDSFNEKMLNPLDTIKNLEEKGSEIIHGALDSGLETIDNLINK